MNIKELIDRSRDKLGDELECFLAQIPSETSLRERRLLYLIAKYLWDGNEDILEIGPFLGGTTRALALGALHNKSVVKSGRVRTIDKFDNYYSNDHLKNYIHGSTLPNDIKVHSVDSLTKSGNFYHTFLSIHNNQPYSHLLEALVFDLESSTTVQLPSPYKILHVDGCKSWKSTLNLFTLLSQPCEAGTILALQDYYWYSCFWLPVITSLLDNRVERVGEADSTCIFVARKRIDSKVIEACVPKDAHALDCYAYERIFDKLFKLESLENHTRGKVIVKIQLAAAYAYIGKRDLAKDLISCILEEYKDSKWADLIRQAQISPTYNSKGAIFLHS